MYIPKPFEVSDRDRLVDFIKQNSFGILFSQSNGQPFATHLPFMLKRDGREYGDLFGHMAKANPHWKAIDQQEVLVVFQGPHAYISAAWYGEPNTVPTWNYVAVHVYGKFILIEDRENLKALIRDSVRFFEPLSPVADLLNEAHIEKMLDAIIGFRIRIERMEGKWKLSQNHSVERQRRVIEALKKETNPLASEIARLMEMNLQKE